MSLFLRWFPKRKSILRQCYIVQVCVSLMLALELDVLDLKQLELLTCLLYKNNYQDIIMIYGY